MFKECTTKISECAKKAMATKVTISLGTATLVATGLVVVTTILTGNITIVKNYYGHHGIL